jgi:O-methyltransferase involved in polyketide biosynthesis
VDYGILNDDDKTASVIQKLSAKRLYFRIIMKLTDVSRTAIVTLRSHVLESRKTGPIINDPMAEYCLDKLAPLATGEEKELLFSRRLSTALTNHFALRARKYDAIINDFISKTLQ